MPTSAPLQPPFADIATQRDGNYTRAWMMHQENVVRDLGALEDKVRRGVTDGSDATAGNVGEYMEATGSVSLANIVAATVATLDLSPGDWDVWGNVAFSASSGTHTVFGAGIGSIDTIQQATFPSGAISPAISPSARRYNVSAATTVPLVAEAGFTGTCSANGVIRARRMR